MICPGCGCVFCPDGNGGDGTRRFCLAECRVRAARRRYRTGTSGGRTTRARQHRVRRRRDACQAKTGRYPDGSAAAKAAVVVSAAGGPALYPYECRAAGCGLWHLSRLPPSRYEQRNDLMSTLFGAAAGKLP